MRRSEIYKCLDAYEVSHAVEDYMVMGWHVWPLLKMIFALESLPPVVAPVYRLKKSLVFRCLNYLRHRIALIRDQDCEHSDPYDSQRDAVILTPSGRRVWMDGALYEIYSDPLVEHLHELGLSTLVWETGKKCFPRYSRSAWISRRMIAECAKLSLCQSFQEDPKPAWAADYLTLACEIMGRPVAWSEITMIIGSVTQEALIFERWLRKSGARCLFVVCWYGPQAMAAIMAARRCGIKTVDLQHGIQGGVWPSWIRSPHNGYEVMPEIFWCWGGATVDELKLHSPAFSTHSAFVAGGNLWLNRWCNSTHSAEPYPISVDEESVRRKTILVSLSFDVEPLLLEAIEVSPDSWVWLIRFHPSRKKLERDQDEKLFMNTGHSGLDLKRANSSLLYELLDDVDVHVTGHSVCAVEALAFGVPSIIISELGREYFSSYIDHGLMMAVGEKSELVNEIKQVRRTAPKEIPSIARLFSSDSDAREALRSIFVNLRS